MKLVKALALLAAAATLTACSDRTNKSYDTLLGTGIPTKHLSTLKAGIWVDPTGCDHWIIDDGFEGYLSARVDKYGKPVCSGAAAPNTTAGDYKVGIDPI